MRALNYKKSGTIPVVFALIAVLGCSTANGFVPQGLLSKIFKKPRAIQSADQPSHTLTEARSQKLQAMIKEARILEQQGDYAESITRYRAILEIAPDSAISHHSLAVNLDRIGNVEESQAHYKEALRLQPKNAEVVCDYGYSLYLQGNVDAAVSQYHEALRMNPQFKRAHNNLGLVYAKHGHRNEALQHFQMAGCDAMKAEFNFSFGSSASTQPNEAGVPDVRQAQYFQSPATAETPPARVANFAPSTSRTPIAASLNLPPVPVPIIQPAPSLQGERLGVHPNGLHQQVANTKTESTEHSIRSQSTAETPPARVANFAPSTSRTPIAASLNLPPVPIPIIQPTPSQRVERREVYPDALHQQVANTKTEFTERSIRSQSTAAIPPARVANVAPSTNRNPVAASLNLPPAPIPIIQPTPSLHRERLGVHPDALHQQVANSKTESTERSVLIQSNTTQSAAHRSHPNGTNEPAPIVASQPPSAPVVMNFRSGSAETVAKRSQQVIQRSPTEYSQSVNYSTDYELLQPLAEPSRFLEPDLSDRPESRSTPTRQTIASPLNPAEETGEQREKEATIHDQREKDTTIHDQSGGPNAELTQRRYQARQVSYLSVNPGASLSIADSNLAMPPAPRIPNESVETSSNPNLMTPERDEMTGHPEYLISDPNTQLRPAQTGSGTTIDPYFAQPN